MRTFLAAVLILCLSGHAWATQEEQRLKELSEKVKAVDAQRRSVERGLQTIDARSASIRLDIEKRRADLEARRRLMQEYQDLIARYESSLADTRILLRNKAIGLYKGAAFDLVGLALAHEELSGYLEATVAHDREALGYYVRVSRMKKAAQKGLELQTKGMSQDLAQLSSRMKELGAEKEQKRVLLASLQKEALAYQNEIERLMERMRTRKKQEVIAYTGIAKYKGTLPWPVKGEIVRRFGTYRVDGVAQISQGLDIQIAGKSPVKSIFQGKIAYLGSIDRSGNTVIVDHGGGYYSIYGHVGTTLKREGEEVAAQEVIAHTGESENTSAPVLHFEIRYHGKPQDPLAWLRK